MSNREFIYNTQIKEFHLDTFGHVNNAAYLSILEDARWEFITNQGYGLKRVQELQIGPTILEIKLRFRRELVNRANIKIVSTTRPFVGRTTLIEQKIYNEEDQLCCEAELLIGLFDMTKRKLIPPTDEWLGAIGQEA